MIVLLASAASASDAAALAGQPDSPQPHIRSVSLAPGPRCVHDQLALITIFLSGTEGHAQRHG